MVKKFLTFLSFFISIILLPFFARGFNCTIRENSCAVDEIGILSLAQLNNSHVGSYDQYTYKVCCGFYSASIKDTCAADEGEVLSLYDLQNAHAAKKEYFTKGVCAKFFSIPANCTIRENSCLTNEVCVISLAKEQNAHAAKCEYYSWKICCRAYSDLYVNESSISLNITEPYVGDVVGINVTVWNIGDAAATNVNVSCYDNGSLIDYYIISSVPPDPSMQEPRYAYCIWQTACPTAHNISIEVDPGNVEKEYNESNNFAWRNFTLKEKLFVQIDSPSEGESFYRGDDVSLQSTVNDSCAPAPSYTVDWYNETDLIGTGEDIIWTIPLDDYILGNKTIKAEASAVGYTTVSDTVQIEILNNIPTLTDPAYNVSPPEILAGESIEISCDVYDVEDTPDLLQVNISVMDAAGSWDNVTASRVGNTFYRVYSTTEDSPLGNYTSVCSALDTDNGYNTSSSQFLVYQNATVTISLNATQVWWNDAVNSTVQAIRDDGSYVSSADTEIKLGNRVVCSESSATDSLGKYSCVFHAPNSTGTFVISAYVTDPLTGKTFFNSTLLEVRPILGEEEEIAPEIACYEIPQIIQNPDGTIEEVKVRICVWK
jgi:hypothetical protein